MISRSSRRVASACAAVRVRDAVLLGQAEYRWHPAGQLTRGDLLAQDGGELHDAGSLLLARVDPAAGQVIERDGLSPERPGRCFSWPSNQSGSGRFSS